jgi:hypothetical protein
MNRTIKSQSDPAAHPAHGVADLATTRLRANEIPAKREIHKYPPFVIFVRGFLVLDGWVSLRQF